MKQIAFSLTLILGIGGCQSVNMDNLVNHALDKSIDAYGGSASSTQGNHEVQYSKKSETFRMTDPKRSSRDFGHVEIANCIANPDGVTKVILQDAKQQDSGGRVSAQAYLYRVSPEGWLVDKPVTLHQIGKESMLNSGKYYVKAQNSASHSYASGEVNIRSGQTNVLQISVE